MLSRSNVVVLHGSSQRYLESFMRRFATRKVSPGKMIRFGLLSSCLEVERLSGLVLYSFVDFNANATAV